MRKFMNQNDIQTNSSTKILLKKNMFFVMFLEKNLMSPGNIQLFVILTSKIETVACRLWA